MLIKVHLYVKDQKTKLVKYRISDFVNHQFLQLFLVLFTIFHCFLFILENFQEERCLCCF